jgi:hypothetical protein
MPLARLTKRRSVIVQQISYLIRTIPAEDDRSDLGAIKCALARMGICRYQ